MEAASGPPAGGGDLVAEHDLARVVGETPHLAFAGLQAYRGSAQHLRGWEERRQARSRKRSTGRADR